MDEEEWEVDEVEVRMASGESVPMARLRIVPVEQTLLCRFCGREVFHTPEKANPWRHINKWLPDGTIICRDEDGKTVIPVTVAEPTQWSEVEE